MVERDLGIATTVRFSPHDHALELDFLSVGARESEDHLGAGRERPGQMDEESLAADGPGPPLQHFARSGLRRTAEG
jgi:hypothetical protein